MRECKAGELNCQWVLFCYYIFGALKRSVLLFLLFWFFSTFRLFFRQRDNSFIYPPLVLVNPYFHHKLKTKIRKRNKNQQQQKSKQNKYIFPITTIFKIIDHSHIPLDQEFYKRYCFVLSYVHFMRIRCV